MKSSKPDSWVFVLLLLPLSWVFCTCSSSLSKNREPPSSISNQFLFISQPFLCQDQSLKPLPMHFIFITHFSIMISSFFFFHFIIISHAWTVTPFLSLHFQASFSPFLILHHILVSFISRINFFLAQTNPFHSIFVNPKLDF